MRILKFGGSSLATPASIRGVGRILLEARQREPIIAVVSAFQGVTNQLIDCARRAERADGSYEETFDGIARRHRAAVTQLVKKRRARVRNEVDELLAELESTLQGIHLLRHCPLRALDMTASFGERLSATIVAAYLDQTVPSILVDSRDIVVTDDQFTHAAVMFRKTNRRTSACFKRLQRDAPRAIPVVTGFIGATEDGQTTTIGRNGSDYSAAIVGAAVGASLIEIWTDVDGVLSADPRIVPSAFVLPQMTYEEAMELSYFGAKVLHSATIAPAVAKRIPILIKNTFNPDAPGTLISRKAVDRAGDLAKGITSVGDLSLLTLRGSGMVGVPGVAERLFRALAARRVSVVIISQASSEHTICFGVRSVDASTAVDAIRHEFQFEFLEQSMLVEVKDRQAILAVVGEGMKGRPGVAGKVFEALGRQNINISAIAQGGSERNISCVIDEPQQGRALNAIHQSFFETRKRLALAVVGVGNVGGAVLQQIRQQRAYLLSKGFDVAVVGVANSKRFVADPRGIDLAQWKELLQASANRMDAAEFAARLAAMELTNAALVDCTSGPTIVDGYPAFIDANLHIITPNKWANALPWRRYSTLMDLLDRRKRHFLFEANVGAGLPVVSTLRDLIASGDEIVRIEGILSGTLSYLFNTFDGTAPFSALVRDAHRMGFTEPDPREDLSGQDVARKLLILARQIGLKMDLDEVKVDSLVPRSLARGKYTAAFLDAFARHDAAIAERVRKAASRGAVLRYVGTLERGRARAGLKEFPAQHPVASAKGSDNVIAFTTKRYSRTPLVVQGPGAGADVTAMGVFSDILKLLHYLPR
ncbi:MAG TPA: bifunctional aspartate kinase/homoserine dehydrogenase I [Vicinamibacterales bacterium]|nr:bifunctional aspartate kinase/homoserine dehydrogenase I [Vicinamibacterales bacterium]